MVGYVMSIPRHCELKVFMIVLTPATEPETISTQTVIRKESTATDKQHYKIVFPYLHLNALHFHIAHADKKQCCVTII